MLESKQSRMQQFFTIQDQKTPVVPDPIGPIIELISILFDTNILSKFGADWSIYTDIECKQSQM